MKHIRIVSLAIILSFAACKSSKTTVKQEVVYTVGASPMYLDEFEYVFNKNKNLIKDTINDQYVEDYLQRSINYKLKLNEAYDLKMDTVPSYKRELEGYRQTLAKSYLTDKNVTESLKKEAYERMQYEVRASHILVMIDQNAKAEDTAKAFAKIEEIRNKIVAEGQGFATVAGSESEDPSAKTNKGDLGYFSTLQMIYPFENQAYNTPVGSVSPVFRTRFGYHILKVFDKRPTAGNVHIAHLFISSNPDNESEVKNKINAIHQELSSGKEFEALVAKHSEDQTTKNKGGSLGFINNYSNYPSDFKNVVFNLKNDGEISKPFKTKYGWHIAKRIEQKPLDSYDKLKYTIDYKVSKDSRSNISRQAVINRIKKESNFKEAKKAKGKAFSLFNDEYINGTWKYDSTYLNDPLFSFEYKTYTIGNFANFMQVTQRKKENVSLSSLLEMGYNVYVDKTTLEYEEAHLNQTNEDFRNIYREYRDAILVFNISGDKVWNKASSDTTGLQSFFDKNKDQYKWEERLDAVVFNASSEEMMRKCIELSKQGLSTDSILSILNKKDFLNLVVKEGKYQKGDNVMVDKVFEQNNYKSLKNSYQTLGKVEEDQYVVVLIKKWLPVMNKELNETRGPVISDYQKVLDEDWIKALRVKYPVVLNDAIYQKFKTRVLKSN